MQFLNDGSPMKWPSIPIPLHFLFRYVELLDPEEDTEVELSVERGFLVARARILRGNTVYRTEAFLRSVRLEGDMKGQWMVLDMPEIPSIEAQGDWLARLGLKLANALRNQVSLEMLAPVISKALPGFMVEETQIFLPLPKGRLPGSLAWMLAQGMVVEVTPRKARWLNLNLET